MSKKGKWFTAIVLFVLMLPAMAMVWVKDSRKDPSYCQGCHADPYYTSWVEEETSLLAYLHFSHGVSCQTCHDRTMSESVREIVDYLTGNYYVPLPKLELTMETCFACHESYKKVIPLTNPKITGAERNPHAGHWGELECNACHNMHRVSVDYCAECHSPVTDAPGWVTSQ
jgi:hypothetical protein